MELKYAIPLCVLLLAGCQREQWDDCITSTGPKSEEVRAVGNFTSVDIQDRIDLVLESRAEGSIAVEAGRNLIGQVRTDVRDGVLYIESDITCRWVRSFKPRIIVKVPITVVELLVLRGTGNVTCTDTIVKDLFRVEQWGAQGSTTLTLDVRQVDIGLHTGAGDVTLRGRCSSTANLYSGIMGPIDASGMRARFVNVNNSGVSDIRCTVENGLDVQIRDVGDVYYHGAPTVNSNITGSGELIRLE